MKKILVFSYSSFPHREAEAIVALKNFIYLKNFFILDIFTKKDSFNIDYKFDNEILGEVNNISFYLLDNGKYNVISRAINKFYSYFDNKSYYEHKWLKSIMKHKIDVQNYDIIYSRSMPIVSHIPAMILKKRYPNIPWIVSFSDPLCDSLLMQYSRYKLNKIKNIERKIIYNCDHIIFNNEQTLNLVLSKYTDGELLKQKSSIVSHSFVPKWYDIAVKKYNHNSINDKLTFSITGNFFTFRSPLTIFDIFSNIVNKNPELEDKIRVNIYGEMSNDYKIKIPNNNIFNYCGSISYLNSLSVMEKSDYLILIDSLPINSCEKNVYLPSKLIDYLGSKTPIIAFTQLNSPTADVIRRTNNILIDINNYEKDSIIIEKLIKQGFNRVGNNEYIEEYNYEIIGGKIREIFNDFD